jgi:hypothetical protein
MTHQLSPGVLMLVERLKTHPEDFFGDVGRDYKANLARTHNPRFSGIEHRLNHLADGQAVREKTDPYWFLTLEEKEALIAAYREAARAHFDAEIIYQIMREPEPEPNYDVVAAKYAAGLATNLCHTQSAVSNSVLNGAFLNGPESVSLSATGSSS